MVDFAKQNDVKRWLNGKPREVAVIIAARAALRVVPLLVDSLGGRAGERSQRRKDLVLQVFRAVAAAWVAGQYPTRGVDPRPAANAVNAAAFDADEAGRAAGLAVVIAGAVTGSAELTGAFAQLGQWIAKFPDTFAWLERVLHYIK